ncbi:hypothetical protein T459_35500 [Capsicum annuum]|uniref:Pre-mRNA-splicing factor SLU7 n=1 Tax=Capsicum annuum TaxID=4072 RepID=A0A2G2XJ98_CAPAN|nr:hypothetical protein T459_35500 [Capsicum annuum]
MEKPTLSNPTNVVAKEVEVQQASVKMPKERIEKFSTKISSSKGDMHTKMDEEHLIFHYIPRDSRKEGQPLLEVCTQQSHPPRRETSHKPFQDLKKIMTIPIIQVPSITPKLLGSNTLAHQIKEAQMKFRKNGNYVATPKFGLGFKLPEPLRISTKKGKETTSSHYASVQKDKEFKDEKIPLQTSVVECIRRLTPRVSVFEILGCKGKTRASRQMKEEAYTSRGSVF